MNILHMKYAVEVAGAGSINRAAETLLVAQPNLSRSIKELETDLHITIFRRTPQGMILTPEGEEFIGYAAKILNEIEDVERMYQTGFSGKQRFSISVPRASYISDAFARFSRSIVAGPSEIYYQETNSARAISNILSEGYRLGIIRYAADYDQYFKEMLEEKSLTYELIAQFHYVLIMNRDSRLSGKSEIRRADLNSQIEIAHADHFVPSLHHSAVMRAELSEDVSRRIFVFDRASQFNLLYDNPETYMWVSPVPQRLLTSQHLVQRDCQDNTKLYRDVLIYRKGYKLTDLDKAFISELGRSKRDVLK